MNTSDDTFSAAKVWIMRVGVLDANYEAVHVPVGVLQIVGVATWCLWGKVGAWCGW